MVLSPCTYSAMIRATMGGKFSHIMSDNATFCNIGRCTSDGCPSRPDSVQAKLYRPLAHWSAQHGLHSILAVVSTRYGWVFDSKSNARTPVWQSVMSRTHEYSYSTDLSALDDECVKITGGNAHVHSTSINRNNCGKSVYIHPQCAHTLHPRAAQHGGYNTGNFLGIMVRLSSILLMLKMASNRVFPRSNFSKRLSFLSPGNTSQADAAPPYKVKIALCCHTLPVICVPCCILLTLRHLERCQHIIESYWYPPRRVGPERSDPNRAFLLSRTDSVQHGLQIPISCIGL